MSRIPGTKACHACHRAKRKCGKQTPLCLRCKKQGIECTYPASKPTCFVLCDDDFSFNDSKFSAQDTSDVFTQADVQSTSCPAITLTQTSEAIEDTPSLGFDLPTLSDADDRSLVKYRSLSGRLTATDTCDLDQFPQPDGSTLRSIAIVGKLHTSTINRWLRQWVDTGSNPFIHKWLYKTRFPRCIQDAYMVLSCYLKKTASNDQVITHIIEDRVTQLLQDYAVPSAQAQNEQAATDSVPTGLDNLEHIARVQALLIYQYLGLYDGDIRMRFVAEGLIPVLYSWVQQMFEHYSRTACVGSTLDLQPIRDLASIDPLKPSARNSDQSAWYEWIIAETIRRTTILACGVQTLYIVLQQGGTIPCQKNIMYTPHKGLWEADSPIAWEKLCEKTNVTLVQTADSKQVLATLGAESVDDFATLVLQVRNGTSGVER